MRWSGSWLRSLPFTRPRNLGARRRRPAAASAATVRPAVPRQGGSKASGWAHVRGHRRRGAARRARGRGPGPGERRARGVGRVRAARRVELRRHRPVRVAPPAGVAVRHVDDPARLRVAARPARRRGGSVAVHARDRVRLAVGAGARPRPAQLPVGAARRARARGRDRGLRPRAARSDPRNALQRVRRARRVRRALPREPAAHLIQRGSRRGPVRGGLGRGDDAVPARRVAADRALAGRRDRQSGAAWRRCSARERSRCCWSSPTSRRSRRCS